jgi:hypothetical protein
VDGLVRVDSGNLEGHGTRSTKAGHHRAPPPQRTAFSASAPVPAATTAPRCSTHRKHTCAVVTPCTPAMEVTRSSSKGHPPSTRQASYVILCVLQ